MDLRKRPTTRRLATLLGSVVACAALVPTAFAGATPWAGTATDLTVACQPAPVSTPFAAIGDTADFFPVPNGGLEEGSAGWTLTGGAAVVDGNEPFFVGLPTDSHALRLGAGATATSPATCVGKKDPYARAVVNGSVRGELRVAVVSIDRQGREQMEKVRTLKGTGSWTLSDKLDTRSNPLFDKSLLQSGAGTTAIAFRFTVVSGTWTIDDLYVDPFKLR